MLKIIKKVNLILAIVLIFSAIFPALTELSSVIAAEYKITWNGKVKYRSINCSEILQ